MATQTSFGAEDYSTIDVLKADELIGSGNYGYLDVRTEEEFKKGHVDVKNPLNIAYMFNTSEGRVKNPNFLEQVLAVCNKDDQLVVGCQSGVRSVYATIDLQNIGFKHLYNMGGGYLAWVENGLPITKPEPAINLTINVNQPESEKGLSLTSNEVNAKIGLEEKVEHFTEFETSNDVHDVKNNLPEAIIEPKLDNNLAVTVTERKTEL